MTTDQPPSQADATAPKRRGVRLSADEAWDTIEQSHTGILTTLRHDGMPISLPVWFVTLDREIYVTTPGTAKKLTRIRRDARAAFLVESGERWVDLKAVHLTGRATVVDDLGLLERVQAKQDEKYRAFRMARREMPSATQAHYGRASALIRFEPDERIVSWENAKLFGR
jgi:nitroimidazol reductase NimA-like FMN-containing flavoprotein (pyridoxamine 5'-phosphate oxidase superfamily)